MRSEDDDLWAGMVVIACMVIGAAIIIGCMLGGCCGDLSSLRSF